MTDMYTPSQWGQGYGWGQGAPQAYGTAPAVTPNPSTLPPYGSAAVTAANGGVPPGAEAQQAVQNRFTPQQMQLLQYLMGGRGQQGQQQMLMQLLQQRLGQGQGNSLNMGGGNLNNAFLQQLIQQHLQPQVPTPSP